MKAPLLAALLAATVLAGCVGGSDDGTPTTTPTRDAASPAVHAIRPAEQVWVTASDGARLDNAVFRPDTDEPVPVFINFSPYWGDSAMAGGDAFAQYMVEEYVPRGYAVVLSAVRGTGHSEGCFEIGSDRESQDVHEVVDHFSKQPWSTGAIAAGGKSYDSTSQNGMVAKFPHPALKGIFHVSGITDMYRYSYKDGVTYSSGPEFTLRYFASQGIDEYAGATNNAGSPMDEDPDSLARAIGDAACVELPAHAASSVGTAATGLKDAYWQERDWTRDIASTSWNGSIFFVHGLQDWNVKPDHIQPWIDLLPADVKVLGWLHQWTQGGTGHVYPMRTDWNATMLQWLDHVLKGHDNGMDQRWGWESQATDGTWRRSATWPVGSPLPSRDDLTGATLAMEAFGAPQRIVGPMVAYANATVPGDGVLTAALYDESPSGARTWLTEAVRRTLVDDELDGPAPVSGLRAFRLESYPIDHVVEAGHRLVVVWQEEPRHALATPAQLRAPTLLGQSFQVTNLSPDVGLLPQQPEPMACFAC